MRFSPDACRETQRYSQTARAILARIWRNERKKAAGVQPGLALSGTHPRTRLAMVLVGAVREPRPSSRAQLVNWVPHRQVYLAKWRRPDMIGIDSAASTSN